MSARCISCTADSGAKTWSNGDRPKDTTEVAPPPSEDSKPKPFLQKLKTWIFGGPLDKERLKSLGLGAFLAYGCGSLLLGVTGGQCQPVSRPVSLHQSSILTLSTPSSMFKQSMKCIAISSTHLVIPRDL